MPHLQAIRAAAVLALALTGSTLATPALAAPPPSPLHAVVNIDLMPSDEAEGTRILADYVAQMRETRAMEAITLIRQNAASNHFILLETFADDAQYRRVVGAQSTRRLRAALYPHLGSPWDERLGREMPETGAGKSAGKSEGEGAR